MSLRSPLGTVLGSGSAKEGTEHFWMQRLTAAALVFLGCWFALSLAGIAASGQAVVTAWIATPLHSVLLVLLTLSLAWHSSLGVQIVIEDYVHGAFTKLVSLIVSKFAHAAVAAASVFSILKIAFATPA